MRPSRLLVLLFAALVAVCTAGWLAGYLNADNGRIVQYIAGGLALLLALAALVDAFWQRRQPEPNWERSLPHQFIQGRPHEVELTLTPPAKGRWRQPQTILACGSGGIGRSCPAKWTCCPLSAASSVPI